MEIRYKRGQEFFEAVQFIQVSQDDGRPEFDHITEWIIYALKNKLLYFDGNDLLWGYKELDRRTKPGNWIIRSSLTGALEFKSDPDFRNQFEIYIQDVI